MLDARKEFLTMVARHRPRLPREAVDTPSLETLQAASDAALSNVGGRGDL